MLSIFMMFAATNLMERTSDGSAVGGFRQEVTNTVTIFTNKEKTSYSSYEKPSPYYVEYQFETNQNGLCAVRVEDKNNQRELSAKFSTNEVWQMLVLCVLTDEFNRFQYKPQKQALLNLLCKKQGVSQFQLDSLITDAAEELQTTIKAFLESDKVTKDNIALMLVEFKTKYPNGLGLAGSKEYLMSLTPKARENLLAVMGSLSEMPVAIEERTQPKSSNASAIEEKRNTSSSSTALVTTKTNQVSRNETPSSAVAFPIPQVKRPRITAEGVDYPKIWMNDGDKANKPNGDDFNNKITLEKKKEGGPNYHYFCGSTSSTSPSPVHDEFGPNRWYFDVSGFSVTYPTALGTTQVHIEPKGYYGKRDFNQDDNYRKNFKITITENTDTQVNPVWTLDRFSKKYSKTFENWADVVTDFLVTHSIFEDNTLARDFCKTFLIPILKAHDKEFNKIRTPKYIEREGQVGYYQYNPIDSKYTYANLQPGSVIDMSDWEKAKNAMLENKLCYRYDGRGYYGNDNTESRKSSMDLAISVWCPYFTKYGKNLEFLKSSKTFFDAYTRWDEKAPDALNTYIAEKIAQLSPPALAIEARPEVVIEEVADDETPRTITREENVKVSDNSTQTDQVEEAPTLSTDELMAQILAQKQIPDFLVPLVSEILEAREAVLAKHLGR